MSAHGKTRKDWSDDPRLTAYALGELDESERAALEAEMAGDESAQAELDGLRGFAANLEEHLAREVADGLGATELRAEQRAVIEERLDGETAALGQAPAAGRVHRMRTRDWGAVAATLVIAVGGYAIYRTQGLADSAPTRDASLVGTEQLADGGAAPRSSSATPGDPSAQRFAGRDGTTASPPAAANKVLGPKSERSRRALGYADASGLEEAEVVELALGEPVLMDQEVGLEAGRVEGNREAYQRIYENSFLSPRTAPLSTFSIDVDTASYSNVRRMIEDGYLPNPDAVRIEELINYFPYDYPTPEGEHPFSVNVEVGSAPWRPQHRLVRVGLKGVETLPEERRASNLVFLMDVSGSMNNEDKLPLLKQALHLLVQELDERDTVSIVVYAGASGLALPATRCDNSVAVHMALERLKAGGSTNGGAGIELAYRVAQDNFIEGGINRVILATDGDFNVGLSDDGSLVRLIEEKAETGVFLSVLGFGTGNLQDTKMELLADKGNGNYAYIDSVFEARKVLVDQMGATLETIAKDVKIQVEFNPAEVQAYRLIGYENRLLAAEDFNDDTKDAGEIGAGHCVTALYEVVPHGVELEIPGVDPLRYQTEGQVAGSALGGELLNLKLRYKRPEGATSTLLETPVVDTQADFQELSGETRFAAAVAGFGMILRDSKYKGDLTIEQVSRWARESAGEDVGGYRAQFIGLVGKVQQLLPR